jgi:tetratricopeptide (TPR) repeat protein
MKNFSASMALLCICSFLLPAGLDAQVRLTEEAMTIPTYVPEPANPMPRFYEGRSHQGVQRRIYPYPYDDGLTSNLQDRQYPSIHIENEYIDLAVMPTLGGRIYYANDKTNGYNYLYHNHVVKPSLIGMVGNWISGSLAWGYPHHHGPHTVEAMDYKITEGEDGSRTVWINTTDRLMRVNILVGYTVYPGSSLIEMSIHPRNGTDMSNSFLFWANPAVHADSAYQVIFPPSVQYVTFHGKRDMTTWPIADSWFNNYDFTGMDVSWWKHTHVPSSFFSWDPREDYFGGYDHNLKAGTAWVGNHYVSPGMKYWADGNNANGLKTNEGLTDADGRYIEMMAGFYTDNQPDYSWLQPYETKSGTMIWFPIRDLDGLKYANRNGALNYFINGSSLDVRLNSTSVNKGAVLVVKAGGVEVSSTTLDISPASPQRVTVAIPAGTVEDDLSISLLESAKGQALLAYTPKDHHPPKYDKPEPLKSLPKPEEMSSVEELYLAGLRLNQFYNAMDPAPYYKEALKRDPSDYRTNTQLGILAIRDHNWTLAESYLKTAVARITSNYTRPKDGEGLYYLAIALRALGNDVDAYDYFYQASWTHAWHSAAYYQLAEMDCVKGDFETALDHVERSISTNTGNIRALNLKAMVLRKLGRPDDAARLAAKTIDDEIISHAALNELYLSEAQLGNSAASDAARSELSRLMRNDIQPYLELSTEYMAAGLYSEAADILGRIERTGNTFPMLYYYTGYMLQMQHNDALALTYYQKAATMPHLYCYPFRSEEVTILNAAMAMNPTDAMAPYYLGNLLYEHQPEAAITAWEKSVELNPTFYITHRNLGLAYKDIRADYTKALASMEQAVSYNRADPRLLYEIDVLNELNRVSPKQKYDLLKNNMKTAEKRSETLLRYVTRAVEYGKYDEALKTLRTHSIAESEGAREMQNAYLNIYTLKALELLKRARTGEALTYITPALDYPIGLNGRSRYAQFNYIAGLIYKKKGEAGKAEEYFRTASATNTERGSDAEYVYYKAMALRELGDEAGATQLFNAMLTNLNRDNSAFFTQFEGGASTDAQRATNHYLAGLAYKGLGEKTKAAEEFNEALKINPGHVWSRYHAETM